MFAAQLHLIPGKALKLTAGDDKESVENGRKKIMFAAQLHLIPGKAQVWHQVSCL